MFAIKNGKDDFSVWNEKRVEVESKVIGDDPVLDVEMTQSIKKKKKKEVNADGQTKGE